MNTTAPVTTETQAQTEAATTAALDPSAVLIAQITETLANQTRDFGDLKTLPHNLDGRPFSGLNALALITDIVTKGHITSTYATFEAIKKNNGRVLKDAKAITLIGKERKLYKVFHVATQTSGLLNLLPQD